MDTSAEKILPKKKFRVKLLSETSHETQHAQDEHGKMSDRRENF